ncbi:MAG: hypothetical protein LR017_01315 [Candidatus Pacebacteria bacterium]|nr:hypothetical protein [Candidatus Paceibacterota bacterium]
MNQVSEKSKNGAIKTLAIIGFVAMVVLVVWLFIQVIRVVPTAFSSLASLADSVYNNRPINTLDVALEKSIVNAGDDFTVSWTNLNREGIYTFQYECVDGVSVDVRTAAGVNAVPCEHGLALPGSTNQMDMLISSEKRRFTDVPFTLTFTEINEVEPLFTRDGKVTIINATIPQNVDLAEHTDDDTDTTTDTTPDTAHGTVAGERTTTEESTEVATRPTPTQTTGTTPAPRTPTPTTYSYIPVSYENGFTDLRVTFLGIGVLSGGTFTPKAALDTDEDNGAFQFEVKNIGTKTSEKWSFEAILPSGQEFDSESQTALKPNERAVFTLGFEDIGDTGSKEISVALDVDNDSKKSNNSFDWSVKVTD